MPKIGTELSYFEASNSHARYLKRALSTANYLGGFKYILVLYGFSTYLGNSSYHSNTANSGLPSLLVTLVGGDGRFSINLGVV